MSNGLGFDDGNDCQLLTSSRYIVYHSVVAIVRQCFRPESNESEFGARRSLMTALQLLNTIDVS